MISDDRISKNTADILEAKAETERILSAGEEAFLSDRKNSLAVKYLLIEAVEAITDTCQHILAKTKGLACSGYVDCIVKAGENAILQPGLANNLRKLADLRNSLIHRYWIIDDRELYAQCRTNIDDLSTFVSQVTSFISSSR